MPPQSSAGAYPRLIFSRYTPRFGEVDYTTPLNGPFDMNVPLQAALQEAEAKDCVVVIQISLIPAVEFYGPPAAEDTESKDE
jgi:hypothetical protein